MTRPTAQALVRRTGIPRDAGGDVTRRVEERQRAGEVVAVVADSSSAAEAFAICDLALGLSSADFPARADLLAPSLAAVAEVVETGGQHDRAVRDSVGLSATANALVRSGACAAPPASLTAPDATYLAALGAMGAGWARLRTGRARVLDEGVAEPRRERRTSKPALVAVGALLALALAALARTLRFA